MGSKLSCVCKNKEPSRHNKHNKHASPKVQNEAEYTVKPSANGSPAIKSIPSNSKNDTVAKPNEPIVCLDSAPSSFTTPTCFTNPDKLSKQSPPSIDVSNIKSSVSHVSQPADMESYRLARGLEHPICWRDLCWHLIGSRGLKTDEERVRAIFTWLCSINADSQVFAQPAEKAAANKNTPEQIVEALTEGRATYFQVFQTLCNHIGIECHIIRGLAKGIAYEVGQKLTTDDPNGLVDPKTKKMNPQVAHLEHFWNACKIDSKWHLFDPSWAARRLSVSLPIPNTATDEEDKENSVPSSAVMSKASQAVLNQYQADMFYFMTEPAKLFYTHYPLEDTWKLMQNPGTLKKFQDSVLLKPSFFRYGLGIYSHTDGYIPVKNELTLKFLLPETDPDQLLFTFNLTLEGLGQIYQGKNLSTYGIHTINLREKMVNFIFRFPKKGIYKLLIYARRSGETLFADVCEYKVHALFTTTEQSETDHSEDPTIMPFPPCSQSSYGPTEKASALGIKNIPTNLDPVVSTPTGVFEVKFTQNDPEQPLAYMTARLKSVHSKENKYEHCIVYRRLELPKNGPTWDQSNSLHANIFTIYLPEIGEYAVEIFAKSCNSKEEEAYHLVWQFLVEAQNCCPLSESVKDQLATIEMGPREPIWSKLGFHTLSHHDPLIRIPTVARPGSNALVNFKRSEKELISSFVSSLDASLNSANASAMGSQLTVIERNNSDQEVVAQQEDFKNIKPRECDLRISIEVNDRKNVILMTQMVDISVEGILEEDVSGYLLREPEHVEDAEDDKVMRRELNGGVSSFSLNNRSDYPDRVNFLIRIPKGGHFYKLYFYACLSSTAPEEQIPLVFTYLIEAPHRMTSSEAPYIGSLGGQFPEKKRKDNTVSLRT